MTPEGSHSGGCQCGAVRFTVRRLGRASICFCRMCQKAYGGIGGALVAAIDFTYTRGSPAYFQSSNKVRRGFCKACGTPLTFETADSVDFSILAFDRPEGLAPVLQISPESRLPWVADLAGLPGIPEAHRARAARHFAGIVSYQHPDHDTEVWPAPEARA